MGGHSISVVMTAPRGTTTHTALCVCQECSRNRAEEEKNTRQHSLLMVITDSGPK